MRRLGAWEGSLHNVKLFSTNNLQAVGLAPAAVYLLRRFRLYIDQLPFVHGEPALAFSISSIPATKSLLLLFFVGTRPMTRTDVFPVATHHISAFDFISSSFVSSSMSKLFSSISVVAQTPTLLYSYWEVVKESV